MCLPWQPVHSVWPAPTWSVTSAALNASSAVLSTSRVRAPANGGAISAAHASSARHTAHGASGGIATRARLSPGHDHHACASAVARVLRHPGWRMAPAGAAALRAMPPSKRTRAGGYACESAFHCKRQPTLCTGLCVRVATALQIMSVRS